MALRFHETSSRAAPGKKSKSRRTGEDLGRDLSVDSKIDRPQQNERDNAAPDRTSLGCLSSFILWRCRGGTVLPKEIGADSFSRCCERGGNGPLEGLCSDWQANGAL